MRSMARLGHTIRSICGNKPRIERNPCLILFLAQQILQSLHCRRTLHLPEPHDGLPSEIEIRIACCDISQDRNGLRIARLTERKQSLGSYASTVTAVLVNIL